MGAFPSALSEKIRGYLTRYETPRSAILPALHAIQDEFGYVAEEHIDELEKTYALHRVQVREVLTFYSMYRTTPPKKFEVLFCDNIVCAMLDAEGVMSKIQKHIDACTAQGKESPFGLRGVPCLGVCDGAPAMLVNKDRHLRVTKDNIDKILAQYAPLPTGERA